MDNVAGSIQEFDKFNEVSGARTNVKKLYVISTTDDEIPIELPGSWANLKLVSAFKHLGVWRGRKVTVNEVFADAMREFKSRLQTYMPLKAHAK